MKENIRSKVLRLFLCMALVLSCMGITAMAEEETEAGLQQDLVILYTSDVHCGIDQNFGLAGLAELRKAYEAAGSYTLLVDDGDFIQGEPVGTMTKGSALIDLMNTVGYDIATMGNHEFDYGMDTFLELAEKAEFPYISCNFNYNGELVFDPYVIKEFDGVKIAFVGVTTPRTLVTSTPKYFQDEDGNFVYGFFQDETGELLYEKVQEAVDAARAEGADYVVAMCHLGNEGESSPWRYDEVIENTTGIDIVLDGHSHDSDQVVMKNKDGEDVVRSACGTKLANVGTVTIAADGTISSNLEKWGLSMSASAVFTIENEVTEAVAAATDELNAQLETVVASSNVDLTIYDPTAVDSEGNAIRIIRVAETNLGDLCADAYRTIGEADVAIVNGGGIRTSIPAGDITQGQILSVHPFGNMLTVVEVTGQTILDALEWGTRNTPEENGGFPQVSGMTYEIHVDIPSGCTSSEDGLWTGHEGEYRVQNVTIGGEPLDLEAAYTLASHNYLLEDQGDGYAMFSDAVILQDATMLDNQVLLTYITDTLGGTVGEQYDDPYGEGRITVIDGEAE